MEKMMLFMMILNAIMLNLSNTPITMGFILLIQTLIVSTFMGMLMYNYWFMYMLYLAMIGGMLILFIYFSSLSSNQKFSFNINFLKLMMFLIILLLMINLEMKMNNMNTLNLMSLNMEDNLNLKMSMNKLYNSPNSFIMIIIINYLLMTLFITVKVTNINMGPLRKNS